MRIRFHGPDRHMRQTIEKTGKLQMATQDGGCSSSIPRDAGGDRGGWTKRFVARGPRYREWAALYESLGFEVRVESFDRGDLPEECDSCGESEQGDLWTIYTRPRE